MAEIIVSKPFVLNIDGLHRSFGAGRHVVEDEVANHWYVQEHIEVADKKEELETKEQGPLKRLLPIRQRNMAAKAAQMSK